MRVRRRLATSSGSPAAPPAGTPPVVRGFNWFSQRLEPRPRLTLGLVLVSLVTAVASTAVTFPVVGAGVAVWLVSELPAGQEAAGPWVYSWDAVARLGPFLLVASPLHALRSNVLYAESVARTDGLTGLCNRRALDERVAVELGPRRSISAPAQRRVPRRRPLQGNQRCPRRRGRR